MKSTASLRPISRLVVALQRNIKRIRVKGMMSFLFAAALVFCRNIKQASLFLCVEPGINCIQVLGFNVRELGDLFLCLFRRVTLTLKAVRYKLCALLFIQDIGIRVLRF